MTTVTPPVEAPEKELVFTDQDSIDKYGFAVNNTLPLIQAVLAAYKVVPNQPDLDTNSLQLLFMDPSTFIQSARIAYYQDKYAAKHEEIGISQEKGLEMTADKLPNFDLVVEKINDLFSKYGLPNSRDFAAYSNYAIENDQVVINEAVVNAYYETQKLYLEFPEEFAARELINSMIDSLKKLEELIPDHIFTIKDQGGPVKAVNLNHLLDLIEFYFGFQETNPSFRIKERFYRLHKAYLSTYVHNQ